MLSSIKAWTGLALVAVAFVITMGLGVWQVQRLQWKETLIAQIEARAHHSPDPLPTSEQWPELVAENYDYSHVIARGQFMKVEPAFVFLPSETAEETSGPGFQIFMPLHLDSGGVVFVNRGFIPQKARAAFLQQPLNVDQPVQVTGIMRAPQQRHWFTPRDQVDRHDFYTRDPTAMAKAYGIEHSAPFFIDMDFSPASSPSQPHGVRMEAIAIANNHLSYAISWFALGLTILIMSVYFWHRNRTP